MIGERSCGAADRPGRASGATERSKGSTREPARTSLALLVAAILGGCATTPAIPAPPDQPAPAVTEGIRFPTAWPTADACEGATLSTSLRSADSFVVWRTADDQLRVRLGKDQRLRAVKPRSLVQLEWFAGSSYVPNGFHLIAECDGGGRVEFSCTPEGGCRATAARNDCDQLPDEVRYGSAPVTPDPGFALQALVSGELTAGKDPPGAKASLEALARAEAGRISTVIEIACGGDRCSPRAHQVAALARAASEKPWRYLGARGGGPHQASGEGAPRPVSFASFGFEGGEAELQLGPYHSRLTVRSGGRSFYRRVDFEPGSEYVGDEEMGVAIDGVDFHCRWLSGAALPD